MLKKINLMLIITSFTFVCFANNVIHINEEQALTIGQKIWYNEAAGEIDGLTSWNEGEDFASLGIGHFLWYPKATSALAIQQSFPTLLQFLAKNGVHLPAWLQSSKNCPWPNRAAFYHDFRSSKMIQLRKLLYDTVSLQSIYISARLEADIPLLLNAVAADKREQILTEIKNLSQTEQGLYALIDYANFKGAGLNNDNDINWGLLQVLELMPYAPKKFDNNEKFVWAANQILTYRSEHAKNKAVEKKWLKGWRARLLTYLG